MNGYGFNEMCPQCIKRGTEDGSYIYYPCAYHNGFVDGYDTAKEGYRNERGKRIAELEAQCAALRSAINSMAYFINNDDNFSCFMSGGDVDESCCAVSQKHAECVFVNAALSSDAGAALLKRLEAAEAVCELVEQHLYTGGDATEEALAHAWDDWRKAKGE